MTRQDLVNKSIDKLNTVKEALELIEILEYDECIAVLTGTKNLPYQNVRVGIDFLSYLLKKYGTIQDTLAAYNYGEKGAREYLWSKEND